MLYFIIIQYYVMLYYNRCCTILDITSTIFVRTLNTATSRHYRMKKQVLLKF